MIVGDEDDVFTQGTSLKQLLTHRGDAVYAPRQSQTDTFSMRTWALSSRNTGGGSNPFSGAPASSSAQTAASNQGSSAAAAAASAGERSRKKMQQWVTDEQNNVVTDKPFFDYTFNHSAILSHRVDCSMRCTNPVVLTTIRQSKPNADGNRSLLDSMDRAAQREVASMWGPTLRTATYDHRQRLSGDTRSAASGFAPPSEHSLDALGRSGNAWNIGPGRREPTPTPKPFAHALSRELLSESGKEWRQKERLEWSATLLDAHPTATLNPLHASPAPCHPHEEHGSPLSLLTNDGKAGMAPDTAPFSRTLSPAGSVSAGGVPSGRPPRGNEPLSALEPGNGSTGRTRNRPSRLDTPQMQRQEEPLAGLSTAAPFPLLADVLQSKSASRLRRYYGEKLALSRELMQRHSVRGGTPFGDGTGAPQAACSPQGRSSMTPSKHDESGLAYALDVQQQQSHQSTAAQHPHYGTSASAGTQLALDGSYAPRSFGAVQRFQQQRFQANASVSPAETVLPLFYPVPYDELLEEQRILLEQRDIHKEAYERTKALYAHQTKFIQVAFDAFLEGDFLRKLPLRSSAYDTIPELELDRMRLQRDSVPVMVVNHEGV